MARPNKPRAMRNEDDLAERIQRERLERGWSFDTLAKRLTGVGCAIQGSALFKIEKGEPRRKISVNELVALATVFEMTVEELLTPVEELDKARAEAIVRDLDEGDASFYATLVTLVGAYTTLMEVAARQERDLFEYTNNLVQARGGGKQRETVSLLTVWNGNHEEVQVDQSRLVAAVRELYTAAIYTAGDIVTAGLEAKPLGGDHGKR